MEFITVMTRDQLRGTTQSQSDIAKTSNTLAEPVGVLEHLSKGREKQVDDTVYKTHVQRHDDTNGALVEELDRTGDNIFQEDRERQRGFASTVDVGVSGFLAHAGCFSFQEDGAVGFAEESEADDGCDSTLLLSEL